MPLPHRISCSLLALPLAAALLSGCGGGSSTAKTPPPQQKSASAIKIDNFAFIPRTQTVNSGRVAVTNADSTAHTVTADDGHSFDSGTIDSSSSSTLTVTKPGRYAYHCSIHPFMHGTLVVR